MSRLRETLSQYWLGIQAGLFPWLEEELGELTAKQRQLVSILELIRIEQFVRNGWGEPGRPVEDRQAIARAFVAKAVYNLTTTRQLLERLQTDATLRRLCGWEGRNSLPSESTFCRAFAEFSKGQLTQRVHEACIEKYQADRLVGHISTDSTEIPVRERAVEKAKPLEAKVPRKQGRPKKGDPRPVKPLTRLQRQPMMSLEQMLEELPRSCDRGRKINSHGYPEHWVGYKLHLDVADGQIPISCVLTSASLHDSQVAIPLAAMTAKRVTHLYRLMDSAYDAEAIRDYCQTQGQVPIIDHCPRWTEKSKMDPPQAKRFQERTSIERVYARLKEEFGGRSIRVRGHAKVMTCLMFGILALTADQLLRLVSS